ncbi:MAG: arginase family protein [Anaerolineales bacterium]
MLWFKRFRQRVVMPRLPLLPPYWEDDPTFDVDAIDPAYVPRVSNPDLGELTSLQAIRMLRELAIHTEVAGI